jgi:choline kinase
VKCVIVAAGMSTRLRPITNTLPKCLLEVGGKSILRRTVENLFEANIRRIAIVIGFEGEQIRNHLKAHFPGYRFRFIRNPKYAETNNAYSLLLAREFFLESNIKPVPQNGLLVLDSDIVFDPRLLPYLRNGNTTDRIAVRVQGEHDMEEIRVKVGHSGFVEAIGKEIAIAEIYGESIGIEWLTRETGERLFETLYRRVRQGAGRTEFYECAFQEMIEAGTRMKAVDVSEFSSMEIDSLDDLEQASRLVEQRRW